MFVKSILCQAMCHVLGIQEWLGASDCQVPLILVGGETETDTEHFKAI